MSGLPTFEGLLPPTVRLASGRIVDRTAELIGAEDEAIARAVDSRRAEYATGRVFARSLLESLGAPRVPLLREPDTRLPLWPDAFVGSITHSDALCVVAVARATDHAGVGLDVEPDAPTDSEIERVVLRDHEHDWVGQGAGADPEERSRRCRLVFSAKEAVYKAFYPRTRTFWSFQDVVLDLDLEAGSFEASLPESAGRAKATGLVVRREGWIFSAVALPPD